MLPDERLAGLRPALGTRVQETATLMSDGAFDDFFDRPMRALLEETFQDLGAHEGTVWLLDRDRTHLVPRFNTGRDALRFVGSFRQKLSAGMISMVVAMEQPICENEVHHDQRQDRSLDCQLGVVTRAMLAVPLYFGGQVRGVISAVQLDRGEPPEKAAPGFSPEHLFRLQLTAALLSRLIEHALLTRALGLELT